MNAAARFITLEGGEGAGKSSQAKRLSAALEARGIRNVLTREPGGAPGAEQIRKLIVEGEPGRWDALTETLLLYAARADHLAHTIRPALAQGKWVISDRFSDSTDIYQGAGRGLETSTIAAIEAAAIGSFKPDLTVILDVPVDTGLQRARSHNHTEHRFESFDNAFHARLREAFRALAHSSPERCVLIDASQSETDVAASIWRTVSERFGV